MALFSFLTAHQCILVFAEVILNALTDTVIPKGRGRIAATVEA